MEMLQVLISRCLPLKKHVLEVTGAVKGREREGPGGTVEGQQRDSGSDSGRDSGSKSM